MNGNKLSTSGPLGQLKRVRSSGMPHTIGQVKINVMSITLKIGISAREEKFRTAHNRHDSVVLM